MANHGSTAYYTISRCCLAVTPTSPLSALVPFEWGTREEPFPGRLSLCLSRQLSHERYGLRGSADLGVRLIDHDPTPAKGLLDWFRRR